MKINILLDENDLIINELNELGIQSDPNSEYVLMKKNKGCNYIPVKYKEKSFYLKTQDIVYIESIGHKLIIHTKDSTFYSHDRLKQMEIMLDANEFIRVSNSFIISINKIVKIESLIFQKFILHMINGHKVDVTRTYYYIFKEKLGL